MPVDVLDHMEEAWKLERNPFPSAAIRRQNVREPYSPDVFSDEESAFRRKFIRGGIRGGLAIGFLWSQGLHDDTGFGKTTLMQELAKEINSDLGATTLEKAGEKKAIKLPIAAAFSNLNSLNATGLYPVLFNAVIDLATAPEFEAESVFDKARARIVVELESDDASQTADRVRDAWASIGGTSGPLRPELVQAFAAGGGKQLKAELATVSPTARLRNGLQYLDFALAALAAAGIDHLFLMIDQLEDLATNRSVTAPKRSREIGRIRDLLERAPYATWLHMIFTFHNRAAQGLERFWEENRLPPFEVTPSNTASVVLLNELKDTDQVKELLRVYVESARTDQIEDDLLPFESGAADVLRDVSEGRVGVLLNRAHELLNAAAEKALPTISGTFARQYFEGHAPSGDADGRAEPAEFHRRHRRSAPRPPVRRNGFAPVARSAGRLHARCVAGRQVCAALWPAPA